MQTVAVFTNVTAHILAEQPLGTFPLKFLLVIALPVKSNITKMEITNWKECIRNRTKWKKLVEKAKTSLKL